MHTEYKLENKTLKVSKIFDNGNFQEYSMEVKYVPLFIEISKMLKEIETLNQDKVRLKNDIIHYRNKAIDLEERLNLATNKDEVWMEAFNKAIAKV